MIITENKKDYIISFNFNPVILAEVKAIPGRWWDGKMKSWHVPLEQAEMVDALRRKYSLSDRHTMPELIREIPPMPELTIDIPLKRKPFKYQEQGIAAMISKKHIINGDDMGLGKELINGTKILSEHGWVNIEDLLFGDKVYSVDGTLCNVTGVYPQGIKPIYKVTFSDKASIETGAEHLWAAKTKNDAKRGNGWRVVSTETMAKNIRTGAKKIPVWQIPIAEPIQYAAKDFIIPPFILGVLIADGGLTCGLTFCPGDKEIPKLVQEQLPSDFSITEGVDYGTSTRYYIVSKGPSNVNEWYNYIREIGLNVTGDKKRIPEKYLRGSVEQRKELLCGLMDCDGTVSGPRTRYATSSLQLAKDVVSLVQSLGGLATINTFKGRERERDGKTCVELDIHNITILTNFNPFKRESNRVKWRKSTCFLRSILNIEYVRDAEATCISVDHDSRLFVAENHIVTHNTMQTVAAIRGGRALPALIICPATLRENWVREFNMTTDLKVAILTDNVKNTWPTYIKTGMVQVFITNYESLKKYFVINIDKKKDVPLRLTDITFRPEISMFKCIAIDEFHRCKDSSALQSKLVKGITANKEFIFGLTGTPILNKAKDLISQLAIIGLLKEMGGYQYFMKRYCGGDGKSSTNLKELNYKLSCAGFFRRMKKDVLNDLPDKIRSVYPCDIKTRKEYNDAMADLASYLSEYKNRTDDEIAKSMRGEIMVRMGICKNIAARGKMDEVCEYVDEIVEAGEKVIVFIHQKEIATFLLKKYPAAVSVRGDDDMYARQHSVDSFQNNPKVQIIICSIKAAGVGITLTASSRVAFVELPWHSADTDQCEDRAYRIGQKNSVQCTYFIGKNTIDEYIYEIIESKRGVANDVTGTKDDVQRLLIEKLTDLLVPKK